MDSADNKIGPPTQLPDKNGEMQEMPENRRAFARVCRGKPNNNTRKINNKGEITSEEDNEECEPGEIHQITQINKIIPDSNDHYGVEMKINGEKQKFIINIGSLVRIKPDNPTLYKPEDIQPLKERYQDMNKAKLNSRVQTKYSKAHLMPANKMRAASKRNHICQL